MKRKAKMKKSIVFLLSVAMVLTMSVPAFAAETDSTADTESVSAVTQDSTLADIQNMIDNLPDAGDITSDNVGDVKTQLEDIDKAKSGLTDEEIGKLKTDKYNAAVEKISKLEQGENIDTPKAVSTNVVATLTNTEKGTVKSYTSVKTALKQLSSVANKNSEIKLYTDYTSTARVNVRGAGNKLDLNGHTYTYTGKDMGAFVLNSSTSLEIAGGVVNVTNSNDASAITTTGKSNTNVNITIAKDATIKGSCVFLKGKTVTLNVYGTIDTTGTKEAAIIGNGSDGQGPTTVNIYDGAVIKADGIAVYHPQAGTMNIEGGEISGSTAIYMKAGTLNVFGGSITGTGEKHEYIYNGNGANPTGDAIVLDACGYPGGVPVVNTFKGATVISEKANAIECYYYAGENSSNPNADIENKKFVTGGAFSNPMPDEYCADGYVSVMKPNEDGNYTVNISVAQMGDKKFAIIEEALETAKDGDTVELLKDVEVKNGETITIANGVTLKINDNAKLTNEGTIEVYGDITGNVSGNGTINYHIKNIAINAYSDSMKIGETQNLTITKSPENAVENITWSVDNDKVATIDENGNLTAVGEGKVKVTARAADGIIADCTITISKKVAPEAPTGIQGINETVKGRNDGKITGVTDKMEYRRKTDTNSENWLPCVNDTIADLAPGTYEVRIAETPDTEAGSTAEVTIETGAEPTYTLNVTAPVFDTAEYGYDQPAAMPITISSTGNSDADIDSVTVSDVDGKTAFVISGSGSSVAAGAQIDTWTIQPAENLNAGSYKATVTVTYNNNATATAEVDFTVARAVQEAPAKTEIKDSTYTTITLAKIEANKNGAVAEYSIDGGKTWQESNVFENLLPGTEYSFAVKYSETKDGNYAESPISEAVKVSTGIGVTADIVAPDDRKPLSDEKAELEKAMENGKYSDDDKGKLKDRISEIDSALASLENAEKVSDLIEALPDADSVQKSDADVINAAKAAYDNLTAHEKELVGDEAKAKLDSALEALTKLGDGSEDEADFSNITKPENNTCNAEMAESKEALISSLLTEEEKNQYESGKDIKVWLNVTDISETVSDTDKALIDTENENAKIAMYLDIELLKQVGSDTSQHITQTNAPVTITLKLPDSLINSDASVTRTYQVIRVHDEKVTVIPCTYDEENGTISFATDQFSTYALAYVDKQDSSGDVNATDPIEPTKPADPTNPAGPDDTARPAETDTNAETIADTQTGDSSNLSLWLTLFFISGFGVTVTAVRSKKKKVNR